MQTNTLLTRTALTILVGCVLPVAAFAHPEGHAAGFAQGFAHPFGGLDHLLAMIAVGMLAMRFTSARRWLLPACFLSAVVAGGALGYANVPLPYVEPAIALSLIVFGLCIATIHAPQCGLTAAVVALFALFHGHAHGTEMGAGSFTAYGAGFVLATAVLHAAGIALATLAASQALRPQLRFAGGTIAVTGVLLLGGAL
jgi:urease accessory protein